MENFDSFDTIKKTKILLNILSTINFKFDFKILKFLIQHLKIEKDPQIQILILKNIGKISKHPYVETSYLINAFEFLNHDNNITQNSLVSSQLLKSIISDLGSCKPNLLKSFSPILTKFLDHPKPKIRASSLICFSKFEEFSPFLEKVKIFINDSDFRVRKSCLQGVINLHRRGFILLKSLYQIIVERLFDFHEEVRSEAVTLLWIFSFLFPTELVSTSYTSQIKLVNDAFSKLLSILQTDLSTKVRTKVSNLAGSFSVQNVSTEFLLQTFSKEILSGTKKGKLQLSRKKNENSSGNFNNPEDDILVTDENLNLLESGAVGAFTIGLEDEFFSTRNGTVDSICELSMSNSVFAEKSVDFLVDMFSDEIDTVRINAVHSLKKLGEKAKFNEHQLNLVLSTLEDSSIQVRTSIYELLKTTPLSNINCLQASVKKLLFILKKYPEDIYLIFATLKFLGKKHGHFAEFLVEDLLEISPKFMNPESHFDNPHYIGVIIVLLNASIQHPSVLNFLPKYVFKHFHFLKEEFPDFFPNYLKIDRNNFSESSEKINSTNVEKFFTNSCLTLKELKTVLFFTKSQKVDHIINSVLKNFSRINVLDEKLKPKTKFYSILLNSFQLLLKTQIEFENVEILCSEILQNIYILSNQFLGISIFLKSELYKFKLIVHLILLKKILSEKNDFTDFSEKEIISIFSKNLKFIENFCEENNPFLNENKTKSIEFFEEIEKEANNLKPQQINSRISPFFFNFILNFFEPSESEKLMLKMSFGNLTKPLKNDLEKPLTFFPKVPFCLNFEGTLSFILDPSFLVLQIKFFHLKEKTQNLLEKKNLKPFQELYHKPSMNRFTQIKPFQWKFSSNCSIFSNSFLPNSCYRLEIFLCLMIPKDEEEMNLLNLSTYLENSFLLALSNPFNYFIQSK